MHTFHFLLAVLAIARQIGVQTFRTYDHNHINLERLNQMSSFLVSLLNRRRWCVHNKPKMSQCLLLAKERIEILSQLGCHLLIQIAIFRNIRMSEKQGQRSVKQGPNPWLNMLHQRCAHGSRHRDTSPRHIHVHKKRFLVGFEHVSQQDGTQRGLAARRGSDDQHSRSRRQQLTSQLPSHLQHGVYVHVYRHGRLFCFITNVTLAFQLHLTSLPAE
mmetsp:Transcript_55/g.97  ORF Transcript_55/g.97 Transcript_55/m.97 type:complete len:216 (+) Transcript_55:633-1280(+)